MWSVDSFTGELNRSLTFDNLKEIATELAVPNRRAPHVGRRGRRTIIDVLIALPIAFYMAKMASKRMQRILVIAVLTPLWASHLVKAFAWRSVLSGRRHLRAGPRARSAWARPGTASPPSSSRRPTSGSRTSSCRSSQDSNGCRLAADASGDLGASTWQTLRTIVFPLLTPAIIAGSIFSFSLTLGDYITVNIVGGANQMLGNLVYTNVGAANNLPLAAAIALIPIVIMIGYLTAVRRTGALENL
ncbi:ABC transporter permease [Aeromicrobium sp. UC242_57]|uniref:ABC transporter permease n=1 Tax=Aeromicrobium sp. UC242_57 TaxID=3374624 RepID=UPI00379523EF